MKTSRIIQWTLVTLMAMLLPQGVWAADDLETAFVGDKSFFVLRSSADWDIFLQKVVDANGKREVNAIMDADFSTVYSVGYRQDIPYVGTFDGNGHTLNVDITGGSQRFIAPFVKVGDATFRNLHVTGSVKGGMHSAGLVGLTEGTSEVHFERVWVSTTVVSNDRFVGGVVGHADKAEVYISDTRCDGTLSTSSSGDNTHCGSIIGWSNAGGHWFFHRVYDYVAYGSPLPYWRFFCLDTESGNSWGSNASSTLCVTRYGWTNTNHHDKTDQTEVMNLMNGEKKGSWQMTDGKAVPVLQSWPASDDVTFETYDITPGMNKGEEGKVKMTFSCNQPLLWIEGTYTNESGATKAIDRITYPKNTYAGFINLPATEQHKDMRLTVKLKVGQLNVTLDNKNDATMHRPLNLKAGVLRFATNKVLTDAGAVELKWNVNAPGYKDVIEGDQFMVMRSLTGRDEDLQPIGSVPLDDTEANYTYKDSTLVSVLTEDMLKQSSVTVKYMVVRASAQQMWGLSNNAASAAVNVTIGHPHLLRIADYHTAWADSTARTVKVKWQYGDELGAVWDNRARMTIFVKSTSRQGIAVDSTTYVLTADEIAACEKVIQLSRSCVDYSINVTEEQAASPIPPSEPYMEIRTVEDWNAFRRRVAETPTATWVNAVLKADLTVTSCVDASYIGIFDGGGHTLTVNLTGEDNVALFKNVYACTIMNLHLAGNIEATSSIGYAGGLIDHQISNSGSVLISNCRVSATIKGHRVGGFIRAVDDRAQNRIENCLFDGKLIGVGYSSLAAYVAYISWTSGLSLYNCLDHGTFEGEFARKGIVCDYNNGFTPPGSTNVWSYNGLADDATKKSVADLVAILGAQWKKDAEGRVVPKMPEPPLGSETDRPTFYYESLGKIEKESLKAETQQSSVVLSWLKTEDTVDYFEVMRRNTTTNGAWEPIATVTDLEYVDKTVSPVFDYEYQVQSVNDCEGRHVTQSKVVPGSCVKTGKVEGYVRFADGTGIAGVRVTASQRGTGADPNKDKSVTTDESGFYSIEQLPYWGNQQGAYQLTVNGIAGDALSDDCKYGLPVTFDALSNHETGCNFTVVKGVRFSGEVQYSGTSIPVKGARFLVDGREVRTVAGPVESDFQGQFSFRVLAGQHTVQAVMEGHEFEDDGLYMENNKTLVNFQTDVASVVFYDSKRVRLIGRIVGGRTQGDLPLCNGLSTNNLGDSLKMVLTLEGDNASRLVWDVTDRSKKTREEYFKHKNAKDTKYEHQTRVFTTLNRMVVYPDEHTGEYEVLLPPVKWKVQQITAEGYATLFQDGQMGDVLDLTDSLTEHRDTVKGTWKTVGYGLAVTDPVETYHAKYSRIYRSPVLLEYRQQGFDKFDYFGDKTFAYQPLDGPKIQIPIAYGVTTTDEKSGRDITTTHYTFGYPVFGTDRGYGLTLSAVERYYYNNVKQTDRIDVVKLDGGFVTIRNGLSNGTQRDTLSLNSEGEGNYVLRANRTPYLTSGADALGTVTFTLERDGTTFEGEPLRAYVFSKKLATGARDVFSINTPVLVDILRDPPGGASTAKLTKGSTLKLAYQIDMAWSAGVSIGIAAGGGMDSYSGVVAAPMGAGATFGMNISTTTALNTSFDVIFSGSGQRAFSYTMTANEDISTDASGMMVGADADLYIGMETNKFVRPATAIQAISDSAFQASAGALKAGRMVEIASGRDQDKKIYHLVRSEVLSFGEKVNSTFIHSQKYIIDQLLPSLAKECESLMYTGTLEDAQRLANATEQRVYLSLIKDTKSDRFAVMNTDEKGNYVYHTTNANHKAANEAQMNYVIVLPSGDNGDIETDRVKDISTTIAAWANMIARNEEEKLGARDLVKNFEMDGGSSITYSEDFASEYSNASTYNWLGTSFTHSFFDEPNNGGDTEATKYTTMVSVIGPTVAKMLGSVLKKSAGKTEAQLQPAGQNGVEDPLQRVELKFVGMKWKFSLNPVLAYKTTPKLTESEKYNRKESFTIKMDKKSHLSFDLYRVSMADSRSDTEVDGRTDVFVEENFLNSKEYVEYFIKKGVGSRDVSKSFQQPRSFVYRTRAGATCRPWEGERKTTFYRPGTLLDERTKKIENPQIRMDKQSISGVPFGEPARFKIYLTNESEQPEAVYNYFDIYQVDKSNPHGARMLIDGMPLTGNMRSIEVKPGQVTEKTLEVYASDQFDYEGLTIGIISQNDLKTYQTVSFDVHYLHTAGPVTISAPGDKWIMNTDAPYDSKRGWYMPVVISGFDKNQHNFDHIEFQYKESTRGDDYWTNLCGYYADSTLYRAASGTKEMIHENDNIIAHFFGEGTVMEKAYDLRARLFCRNGNAFITSDSKVLTGVKDTRRPQLFGMPDPKEGIIGAGDNIVFNFSEAIEHNYLQKSTNFEVVGETNETALSEEPSLQFTGVGYAETDARRNFADKNMTIDLMVNPDVTGKDMPLFSHGSDGSTLQLWLTKDLKLRAVVDSISFESSVPIKTGALQQVALILDNDNRQALLWNDSVVGAQTRVTYSGYGPLIFGGTNEVNTGERQRYSGRMLEARLWNRAMTTALLNTYGKRLLTGYEMGLAGYWPMNDGTGNYAVDKAQGANAELKGATWALPRGMALRLDWEEEKEVKGLHIADKLMSCSDERDYSLMFWFMTDEHGQGALVSNGSGRTTDDDARNKFFVGFEHNELIYRTNGRTLSLGKGLADGKWHHFAVTVDRSHMVANFYVDHVLTQSISTDTLGGMTGRDFYLGNMVWHEAGPNVQTLHSENALTGYIDELCLFSQALPPTLMKRYSTKSPTGREKGLLVYMGFSRQERQKNNNLELRPYALNQVVKLDMDGKPKEEHDSVFVEPVDYVLKHIDQEIGAPVQANMELRNLNFSFVGRDNQLLVNIDEQDSRINKRNLFVTVSDIPDVNGNYMASPATVEFFVDRNPLRWERKNKTVTFYPFRSNSDDLFTVDIANTSGAAHTYTIANMPRWLTVDLPTDVIAAQTIVTLQFTVSADLNVGTYDEIIYLVDENGLAEPLALTIRKNGSAPAWEVDEGLKHFSMNLVGQVKINNSIVIDPDDKVAAFDPTGRCMGVAYIDYNSTSGQSRLFMTLFNDAANTGDIALTFKLWHHQTGQVMLLQPDRAVTFKASTIIGTAADPVVLTAGSLYYQELELQPGWNWISLNLDNDAYRDVIKMLNPYQWQNGDIVTDDTEDFTLVYNSTLGTWVANNSQKAGYTVSPKRSYRIYVKNWVIVEIAGYPLKGESQRTLTVGHGWNNIGYTPMMNLPVATALADYTGIAQHGDVVKSREEFAMYTKPAVGGGYWSGSLKYMKPGEGYMLYRNAADTVSFHYPYYEPGNAFFENSVANRAQRADYSSNMAVVAAAKGIALQEGDRLVAFCNGEKRGEAVMTSLTAENGGNDETLFFLTIAGDRKAPLTFAIERDGSLIAATAEVMVYENNAVSGSPLEPTAIHFVKMDVSSDSWYTLEGVKLSGKPSRKGVFIHNGKKEVVK